VSILLTHSAIPSSTEIFLRASTDLLEIVRIEDLQACDPLGQGTRTDASAAIKRKLELLKFTHVKALFANRKLAYSTSLIMAVWGLIGTSLSHFRSLLSFPFLHI
jgi:hypothetical protein